MVCFIMIRDVHEQPQAKPAPLGNLNHPTCILSRVMNNSQDADHITKIPTQHSVCFLLQLSDCSLDEKEESSRILLRSSSETVMLQLEKTDSSTWRENCKLALESCTHERATSTPIRLPVERKSSPLDRNMYVLPIVIIVRSHHNIIICYLDSDIAQWLESFAQDRRINGSSHTVA